MTATGPGNIDATRLLPALDCLRAAAFPPEDADDLTAAVPVVSLAGTTLRAGGYDFGILAMVPGLDLPPAHVDLAHLHAVIDRVARTHPALATVWLDGNSMRIASDHTTWTLPLREPPTLGELAARETDTRLLIAGALVPRLIAPARLVDRSRPHSTAPVLEAVHLVSRNGLVTAEAAPGKIVAASQLPISTVGHDPVDLLIPQRLVDVLDAASTNTAVTLTDSHALVGAGPRRALVVDVEEHLTRVRVIAWALTPDGIYPDCTPWLCPTAPMTWTHDTTRAALMRAIADAGAIAGASTRVAIGDDVTTDGLVDLVSDAGVTRAGLGAGSVGDPQVWVSLHRLAEAVRLLPDGPVRISGSGIRHPLHLEAGHVHAAIKATLPPTPAHPID